MIYDVIYIKSGTLSELTVASYTDFKDAKLAAESLAAATCKEVYISMRLGTFRIKAEWFPSIINNSDGSNLLNTLE